MTTIRAYDITRDEEREVTQAEFERLRALVECQDLATLILRYAHKGHDAHIVRRLRKLEKELQKLHLAKEERGA